MKTYLNLLDRVLNEGTEQSTERALEPLSLFGAQMRYNLNEGFPAVTTKKLQFKSMVYELLWFLRGDTNVKWLQENNVRIWDAWARDDGSLGPVYGAQWRSWTGANGETFDQVASVIEQIKVNPTSRRLIVNAWNVGALQEMQLPPCHLLFQFYVANNQLSCQLYQRSADLFLGVPFNIASYALLTHMIAQVTGLGVGDFVHTIGDAHIYLNHVEQVKTQLDRIPKALPRLKLNPKVTSIDGFKYEDISLENYEHEPAIRAPISV